MRAFALFLILAFAATNAFAEEMNIGFIDLQQALNESSSGKKAKTELESLIKTNQEKINEKVAAKERLELDLEKQAVILSPEARDAKEDELEKMEKDIERMIMDANNEMQKKQRNMEISILNELKAIIDEIAKEGNFTLILPADVVIYSAEGNDITNSVIKKYDESKMEKKETEKKETQKKEADKKEK